MEIICGYRRRPTFDEDEMRDSEFCNGCDALACPVLRGRPHDASARIRHHAEQRFASDPLALWVGRGPALWQRVAGVSAFSVR